MDDAKEFIASMLKTTRDRLGNPLVSAFAIAWLIWNFRVVLVLVGEGEGGWRAKIDYLDKTLMIPSYMWWIHGVMVPLLIGCIWIFAMPRLLRWVAMFHARQGHLTKAAMLHSTESEPISEAERTEMWSQMRRRQSAWETERGELLRVIEELQKNERDTIARTVAGAVDDFESHEEADAAPEIESISTDEYALSNAQLLGIDLDFHTVSEGLKVPRIEFHQHPISWPWAFRYDGAVTSGLLPGVAGALRGKIMAELEILILHTMRDGPFDRTAMTWLSYANDHMRVSLERLRSLGLSEQYEDGFRLSSAGRIFLAWMVGVGFEFVYSSLDSHHENRSVRPWR